MTKFCLCSMGIIIGLFIPGKARNTVLYVAIGIFAVTFGLLMAKVFRVWKDRKEEEKH